MTVMLMFSSSAIRELPRVLAIYDIDLPLKDAKRGVAFHFRQNAHLKDPRCPLLSSLTFLFFWPQFSFRVLESSMF